MHLPQRILHIPLHSPLAWHPAAFVQMFRVLTTSIPCGSSVQLRLTSSATTFGARPIVRAIQAILSPLFRPRSISSLSS